MATLTNGSTILATTLAAFKTKVPMLSMITLDARADELKLNQAAIAHVRTLPSASTYDSTTGYYNGSNSTQGLMTDVPITVDTHAHVTLELNYLKTLSDQKIDAALEDAAFVLGKQILDSVLTKAALAANNTYTVTETIANTAKSTLNKVRVVMNNNKADTEERFGLVSTAASSSLDNDTTISSGDYYNQRSGAGSSLVWSNLCGFTEIREYNSLPTTANMSGLFFDRRNMIVRMGLPVNSFELAASLGFMQTEVWDVQQDPQTGIALICIKHSQPGTLNRFITFAAVYGSAAGAQGGSAGAITDKAGCRLVTA